MGFLKIAARTNRFLNKFGYHLVKLNFDSHNEPNKQKVNIGSGNWSCKGWANLDHPSSWYKKAQKKHNIISYDIRKDELPFKDSSVDVAYCSHVVEHIENSYIKTLFTEVFRALKKGGVVRIACPDAEFLYQVSKQDTDFWQWRNSWFNSPTFYSGEKPRAVDYLVREIATPKLLGYTHAIASKDYSNAFREMDMKGFFSYLTNGLAYRQEYPGDHINCWTFEKIEQMLLDVGFNVVIRSKWGASCSCEMKSIVKFDTTYPIMSLYVEAIKQ